MCIIETSPVIETRRLVLRAPGAQDVTRIADMANDHDIARMTSRMPHPFGTGDAEEFVIAVAGQDPRRASTFVIEHEDLGLVGIIGLFEGDEADMKHGAPETGYWIGRDFWGRGFATEALEGALVWASKRWKRRALVAGHFVDNPASGRVLEKAGFLYTGETRRKFSIARSGEIDTRMMIWLA